MKLESLLNKATQMKDQMIAVAAAADEEVLSAVEKAIEWDLGKFMLFGDENEIQSLIRKFPLLESSTHVTIHHAESVELSAEMAVRAIHEKKAHVLMKGNIPTAKILKAVLNKEYGLRTGNVLSHVAVFEVPHYDRFIFVTDAAMNIRPNLEQKAQIIQNAVQIAKSVGIDLPKVAVLAAIEQINPAMPETLDAASLTMMNERGQIKDCLINGPLALDNAISTFAAEQKKIKNEVAGQADILAVPEIVTGNVLYKSLMYFANAKVAAVISGAKAPIVLTSRADKAESKLYSIALAICASKSQN